MKKILNFTFIFLLLNSCNAQKSLNNKTDYCSNKKEVKNFIKREIERNLKKEMYISSRVLEKLSTGDSIESLLKNEAFFLVKKINLKTKKDLIDFTKFFEKEDFDFFKCQLKNDKIKNWKDVLSKEDFKKSDSIANILNKYKSNQGILKEKNYRELLKFNNNFLFLSKPLFTKDKQFAILYRETVSSGSLYVLKKVNDKWIYFARGFVWIE